MPRYIKHIDFTYFDHESLESNECFYCEEWADTADHCPPISLVKFCHYYERIKVRCCRSCNGMLGGRYLPSLFVRVEFLIQRYKKKFSRILKMPIWYDCELEDVNGALKKYIQIEIENKELIKNKISYLEKLLIEIEGISFVPSKEDYDE